MIDALTLDQMRIFVTAVDEGSFSAAARKLGPVQSAVSQSIAALEGHLGVALFDRTGKTPRLTPAGAALAKDARRLLKGAVALEKGGVHRGQGRAGARLRRRRELSARAADCEPESAARRISGGACFHLHREPGGSEQRLRDAGAIRHFSVDFTKNVALHFRVRSPSLQIISISYASLVCPNCRRSV